MTDDLDLILDTELCCIWCSNTVVEVHDPVCGDCRPAFNKFQETWRRLHPKR